MLSYPFTAITAKSIERFTYDLYSCINVNKLKYNNDSSAVLRVISVFTDILSRSIEDLGYQITMTMSGMEFINIDRLAKYNLAITPGLQMITAGGIKTINKLVGFSKYTNKTYTLNQVYDQSEFVRHSFPCDMFLSGDKDIAAAGITSTLAPFVTIPLKMNVKNSVITFKLLSGADIESVLDMNIPMSIRINGLDTRGGEITEILDIVNDIDFQSAREYSFVNNLMLTNSSVSVMVTVFPYITGENVTWQEKYVDRETEEETNAIINIDYGKKAMNINMLVTRDDIYPNDFETIRQIPFKLELDNEQIHAYYADPDNRLIYIVTTRDIDQHNAEKKLYCFPMIIPASTCTTIDRDKTLYQSIAIDYFEDSINEAYTFYIFPTSKTNDVELMNIRIKRISNKDTYMTWMPSTPYALGDEAVYAGVIYSCMSAHTSSATHDMSKWTPNIIEYKSDMLLDLISSDIETNRLVIPFSDLFATNFTECIVEFSTYGEQESVLPIFLYKPELIPLYVKNLSTILLSWGDPATAYLKPIESSTDTEYPFYNIGGLGFGEYDGEGFGGTGSLVVPSSFGGVVLENISDISIYKLSNSGNIMIDGAKVINVFDTFYFDDDTNTVITSDTITQMAAVGDIYNPEEVM